MTSKLSASLRQAPVTLPALVAVALLVVWATDQDGYPLTHWAPGGLIVLGLLGIALVRVGMRSADTPLAVRIALAALAAFTVFSFLSILWAAVPGDAWEGANRTLLYLLVFSLFAVWGQRGESAALLVCAWALSLAGLALYVALHLDGASSGELQRLMPGGRLLYPSGYANANAAQWLMAFWPALLLAGSRRLHWALRGALAGGAVLLASVALLSQSRGSLYSTPVVLALVFALLPGRVRTFAVLVPVAAGIGAAAPAVLRVGDRLHDGAVAPATLHAANAAVFLAALAVALVVAAGAAIESRRTLAPATEAAIHRGLAVVAVATLAAVLLAGWAIAGNPVARLEHAWETFKSPAGYAANNSGSRLVSGLGSQRYDFYRVALNEFSAHPLLGIGADNFAQQYLAHGRSEETPHYPHSVELRTLAETGIVGTLLALIGLAAALYAVARACRSREDPLAGAVAAAGASGFAYWLVHGSFDWLFEFAGLGAAAFALLGIACALRPSAPSSALVEDGVPRSTRALRLRAHLPRAPVASGAALGVVAALAAASLAAPWLSGLMADEAGRLWARAPFAAYARLEAAARLDPLSDAPYLLAGSIAVRFHDLRRADRYFADALERVPGDAYATLERGAIASRAGDRRTALRLLERSLRLQPRNPLALAALRVVRRGLRVNVSELNRAILRDVEPLA